MNTIAPGYVEFNDQITPGFVTYVASCNFCNWKGKPATAHLTDTATVRQQQEDKVWNHARQFHRLQLRKEYGM